MTEMELYANIGVLLFFLALVVIGWFHSRILKDVGQRE